MEVLGLHIWSKTLIEVVIIYVGWLYSDCILESMLRKPNSYQDEFAIGGFPECVTVIARGLERVQAC